MIPHGTIERLEHLIDLIDSKKDYQDDRIQSGIPYRADYEIDEQLLFPPPELTEGKVTENTLYQWIAALCAVYEAEYQDDLRLGEVYRSCWRRGDFYLPSPFLPPSLEEDEELSDEEMECLVTPPSGQDPRDEIPGPIVLADDGSGADEPDAEPEWAAPRLPRGFTDLGLS
jgi:hypothetical protein